ncbi:MAG: GDP-L-fucose synthase [Nitrospiraceae bacterium]|nr:GDP-L-fucose synthase [Nitrospiraceae bacterium]
MEKSAKIYVAGHNGMVGSAITRVLAGAGCTNIITRTHGQLDLTDQQAVMDFLMEQRPEYLFLAAARVGGILANSTYKAQFIFDNISIAANLIHAAFKAGVKKLLNLGSSCIYPKFAPQPMKEEYLLTGPLEPTNEPYAIAKISAIKLCRYYNEQYGTNFISLMPTNLYGPNDNFNLETSHVLPALLRKTFLGKCLQTGEFGLIRKDFQKYPLCEADPSLMTDDEIAGVLSRFGIEAGSLRIWGTGNPFREFLYVDDLADACVYFMDNCDFEKTGEFVNVGTGSEIAIRELAGTISEIAGFRGENAFDPVKPDGTPRKLLDVSRARALGWEARTPLAEGIRKTYEWYVSRVSRIAPRPCGGESA